ncbi:glutaredoxin family protein [Ruicaihuangia caeni]|uniref:Glutaredoxin family protein n=1 Tax=Ruicaihuangia caeni TaxID=3042517 RepID=A0AAW6T9A4_9MICO|nr:glutaredoxin family protein [Klugiella sp. YN-L-19]MDI2098929.1 glutaredoxin family protein [Klugiella sp. YN-L-19]
MSSVRVTLIGKPGCHLCDDAREVVTEVLSEFPAVQLEERDILQEPELFDRYSEEIPVVMIDDRVHNIWRVDRERLRAALAAAEASA